MSTAEVRVVKVGGSLFDCAELKQRLDRWSRQQSPATNVLIAGGGPVVHSIRELDETHHLGELAAHWLCVRAMGITARLLLDMLDEAALVDELGELRHLLDARPLRTCVFDATQFLLGEEPSLPGTALPHGWHVTSDSIAARVAQVVGAVELVLLKSRLPEQRTASDLAHAGFVDVFFPNIAGQLPLVRCVDLRDDAFSQCVISA